MALGQPNFPHSAPACNNGARRDITMMMKQTKEERFEAIRKRYLDAVAAYVGRRAPEAAVEDVVAETFLVCWRKLERVPDEPLPWLYTVARKTLANERRKRARKAPEVRAVDYAELEPAQDVGLAEAFMALSERDREVLRLIAWEELPFSDASIVLGCTPVACRVRFHRAKKRLAERLAVAEASDRATPCSPRTNSQGATP